MTFKTWFRDYARQGMHASADLTHSPLISSKPWPEMKPLHRCCHPCQLQVKICWWVLAASFCCLLLASQAGVVGGFSEVWYRKCRRSSAERTRPSHYALLCPNRQHRNAAEGSADHKANIQVTTKTQIPDHQDTNSQFLSHNLC